MRSLLFAITTVITTVISTDTVSYSTRVGMSDLEVAKMNYTRSFDSWLRTQQVIRERLAMFNFHTSDDLVDAPYDPFEVLEDAKIEITNLRIKGIQQYTWAYNAYDTMLGFVTGEDIIEDISLYTLPMCKDCHKCLMQKCANQSPTCYRDECYYGPPGSDYESNCFALGC